MTKNYKIICVDMFQTLANVDTRIEHIWKRILKEQYTEELMKSYVDEVNYKIINKFHDINNKGEFRTLSDIFLEGFSEIFAENEVAYCPYDSTNIFIEEHSMSEPYHDSIEFIKRAKQNYKVCLVSDADIPMIEGLSDIFGFDKIFISEEYKSYKGNPNSTIFKSVLEYYNVEPAEVIHIGDSSSDIIGAFNAGIDSCWLNRDSNTRRFSIEPTYEVKSLIDLLEII